MADCFARDAGMSRCKASFFVWAHRDSGLSVVYGASELFAKRIRCSAHSLICLISLVLVMLTRGDRIADWTVTN